MKIGPGISFEVGTPEALASIPEGPLKVARHLIPVAAVLASATAHGLPQVRLALSGEPGPAGTVALSVRAADGEEEMRVEADAVEVLPLRSGGLLVLDAAGTLTERRWPDGDLVWTLPGEPVASFALLGDGQVAALREGRLELLNRLGGLAASAELEAEAPDEGARASARTGTPKRLLASGDQLLVVSADGGLAWFDAAELTAGPRSSLPAAVAARLTPRPGGWAALDDSAAIRAVTAGGLGDTLVPGGKVRALGLRAAVGLRALEDGGWVVTGTTSADDRVAVHLDAAGDERWRAATGDAARCWPLDDGPEAALLWRARPLHRRALTLDTHKDISSDLASAEVPEDAAERARFLRRNDPRVWGSNQVDFPKMRSGGLDVAFYIVYVGQGDLDAEAYGRARAAAEAKFDAIHRMADRFPEHIGLATSADDVERIAAEGRLVACIGIENGYVMGEDLSAIEHFHQRGARYMSLTHNRHSQLGDSNTPADEPLHGGLSDLGRRAIEEMNRVGIMVDISHASERTSLEAIAHSKAPVIASHSGVDAVRLHGRNLSDAELDALKANGGVVQCVAFASYVKDDGDRRGFVRRTREELGLPPQRGTRPASDDPEVRRLNRELRDRVRAFDAARARANVRDFVDHIDHAVRRIGVDHVAISSDFDGGGGVEGWNDASETFNVTLELARRGYSDTDIQKIWAGNTLRVWRAVEAVAARSQ